MATPPPSWDGLQNIAFLVSFDFLSSCGVAWSCFYSSPCLLNDWNAVYISKAACRSWDLSWIFESGRFSFSEQIFSNSINQYIFSDSLFYFFIFFIFIRFSLSNGPYSPPCTMDTEKGDMSTKAVPDNASGVQVGEVVRTNAALNEAVDVYGNIETAEELRYVHRG